MESIFKFSCNLYKVVVVEVDFLRTLIPSSYVDLSISEAEVVGGSTVEIPFDWEGLEYEWSLESCADVNDAVVW